MDTGKYKRHVLRFIKRRKAFWLLPSRLRALNKICSEQAIRIYTPLTLISQIQRSGGSLISQLFDGHPQLHAHPHELKIGYPKKYNWPEINLDKGPDHWFKILFEESVIRHFENGYKKEPTSDVTFPFIFLPNIQREIFIKNLTSLGSINLRDVFNAYMSSYFGAWLNNQNYYGMKKFVTGFTPRLSDNAENMRKFFDIYPDGRLISIVRDPKNWFPSALRHNQKIKKDKYGEILGAMMQWRDSAEAMVRNKNNYTNRVCILRFEDLIQNTDRVMRYLSDFLELDFDKILLVPTFNGSLIEANTSFDNNEPGIVKSTLARYKTLTNQEMKIIDEITEESYQRVINLARTF
jgi:hypothetical protein